MTDDAPSNGTPDRPASPPPPPGADPTPTVTQPAASHPTRPQPGAHAGPAVDNPDLSPPAAGPASSGAVPPAPPAPAPGSASSARPARAGVTAGVAAVGSGLLGAAVVLSASRSRATEDGDLDWSNFGVGVGAAAVLLVVALLGVITSRRATGGRSREDAITWPGAVGILATAVMIEVGVDSEERWVTYLIGGVIVVLAALGYVAVRRGAFVVTAIVGLGLLYAMAFDDLIADSLAESDTLPVVAAAVAVFVLVVTILGWLLPSRVVSGVAVGVVGVVAYAGMLLVLVVVRAFVGLFGEMVPSVDDGETGGPEAVLGATDFTESDVWWILAFAGLLTLAWALAAALTDAPGFSLLAIVMPVAVVPLATVALAVERPTIWSGVLAAAGGLLILAGVLLAGARSRRTEREAEQASYAG